MALFSIFKRTDDAAASASINDAGVRFSRRGPGLADD
jgi:hypothetical protein